MDQISQRTQLEKATQILVGENCRRLRKAKGIRQVEVETKCGVAYRHYQDIEAGKINVSIGTLAKLAYAFEAHLIDFFRDSED